MTNTYFFSPAWSPDGTKLAFENLCHPFQPFIHGQKIIGPAMALKFNVPLVNYGSIPTSRGEGYLPLSYTYGFGSFIDYSGYGGADVLHALSLGGVLYALWLLLSGYLETWLLLLGLASVGVAVFVSIRMDVVDHEGHPIHLSWRALLYWPWLGWEIVKANIDVAKAILSRDMPIELRVLRIKASQVTELGYVLFANSITLTPGTVTLTLDSIGEMDIHSLTPASTEGLLSGDMDRRVHELEGAADGTVEEA